MNPPRVGLVVVDDGLYTHIWARRLLEDAGLTVPFVVCLSPFTAPSFNPRGCGPLAAARSRLAYYGLRDSLRFAARFAQARGRDALFRLGLGSQPHSLAALARARGAAMPHAPSGDINSGPFCGLLESYRPDLIVCAFSQKAGPRFLSIPERGCLNVHFAWLPDHRGREPLFWAMLDGRGAGVSVHWMTPDLDAGQVVAQEAVSLDGCRTLDVAIRKACAAAAGMLPMALRKAMEWQGPREADGGGSKPLKTWPGAQDIYRFRRKGFAFI